VSFRAVDELGWVRRGVQRRECGGGEDGVRFRLGGKGNGGEGGGGRGCRGHGERDKVRVARVEVPACACGRSGTEGELDEAADEGHCLRWGWWFGCC
jgi:hypothetical protein